MRTTTLNLCIGGQYDHTRLFACPFSGLHFKTMEGFFVVDASGKLATVWGAIKGTR